MSGSERKRQSMGGASAAAGLFCCFTVQALRLRQCAYLGHGRVSATPAPLPSLLQGVKATLRKLFGSRARSGHQRLPDEDVMEEQHPMAAHAQQARQSSFSFGR